MVIFVCGAFSLDMSILDPYSMVMAKTLAFEGLMSIKMRERTELPAWKSGNDTR